MNSHSISTAPDHRVIAVLHYLSTQELSQGLDVGFIADLFNICPGYFRQIFKRHTGVSFGQHVKALRLRRAYEVLQNRHSSVKQAMITAGFSDHSHFARDYKRLFGESPSQTRLRYGSAKNDPIIILARPSSAAPVSGELRLQVDLRKMTP